MGQHAMFPYLMQCSNQGKSVCFLTDKSDDKSIQKSHCALLRNSMQGIFQAHTGQAKGHFQKNLLPSQEKCLTPLTSLSQVTGISISHPHP